MCLGRYQEAELNFREAVKIARRFGHNGILAVSLDNLGLVLWARRSSLTQSLNFLAEGTTLFNQLGESVQAGNCWLHLFQVCIEAKSDRVLEVGAKAYELLCRVGPAHSAALCLHMLVEVSIKRGSPLMHAYLRELAEGPLNTKTSVGVSVLQAYAAVETGEYLQCLRLLASTAVRIGGTSDWRSVVKSLQYAGAALVALGAHDKARTLYASIQMLGYDEPNLKRYGGFRAVVQLLGAIGLGVVALVSGAPGAAKNHLARAIEIVEGQHGNMLRCRLSPTVATEYANCVTQAASGLDEFCSDTLSQDPALIKLLCMHPGFYTFDLSAPEKFSTISTLQFQGSTSNEDENEAQSFAVFDNRELSDIYRLLIEKVMLPTNAVTEALTILENSRSRFYMEDVRNRDLLSKIRHIPTSGGTFHPASYTEITQWLHSHKHTAMIEFFVGKDAGFAWVGLPFEPVEMRVLELPNATENALAALAKACGVVSLKATLSVAQTAKQSTQAVAELVRELYTLLFADARIGGDHLLDYLEKAGIKRLVLVPYGGLHFMPLHAARDASGTYLCDRFEICYSPNAWFVNRNLTLPRTLAERILVVANPDGSLSSTEAEMNPLYSLFSEGVLLGPGEATLAAVMSGFAGAQGIHFSCHGTFVPGEMDRTGLWLSDKEFLSVRTLMPDGKDFHRKPYAPHLRLAFLAACETGLDNWKPYEEPLSLATSFMATGATSVISTLWSVPNDAAVRLVPAFYTNLRALGLPMGLALRDAINAVRQEWPDPWYWAAYTLSGSWL